MIPALASIIAAYVIFRCVSITLNALVQLIPHPVTRSIAFTLILLGALYAALEAITNIQAITNAATDIPAF